MPLSFESKIRPVGTSTASTGASNLSFASKIRPVSEYKPLQLDKSESFSTGGLLKGIVSAPATMIARPFQAIQSASQLAGMDIKGNEAKAKEISDRAYALAMSLRTAREEDKPAIRAQVADLQAQSKAISDKLGEGAKWKPSASKPGGLIAEAPETASDVLKDVGRGVQTVALGITAPGTILSSGAAFGIGSSLERMGTDIFTIEGAKSAAFETALSMLMAKGMSKALASQTAQKIMTKVGNVVPKSAAELTSKVANSVDDFMKGHEILPQAGREAVAKITSGAQAFDTGVNKTVSSLWKGTKNVVGSQYPGATEKIAKSYEQKEVDRLLKPTKEAGTTFNKSAEVAKDAKRRGIDLEKSMKDNKIYASDYISEGKFDTKDVADAITDEAISGGAEVLRPALREASHSVRRVPISEVRNKMIDRVRSAPSADLSPAQKLKLIKEISEEYADDSVTAALYRNGYDLENLYDSKLQTSSKLYREPKGGGVATQSDALTSKKKGIESKVFGDILVERSPKEIGLEAYMKAQEGKFILANYLKTLDGKKAPVTLFQRAVKRASQLSGATVGAQTAGPFGMFSGYQFGGLMADTFAKAPNPVKVAYLRSIGKTQPEVYNIMKSFVADAEAKRMSLVIPRLAGGSKTDIGLQSLKNQLGSIEMGAPATPPVNKIGNDITQNSRRLFNTKALPAPTQRIITPNTQGTPNIVGAPYASGGNKGAVGGQYQRVFGGNPQTKIKPKVDFKKSGSVDNFEIPAKKFIITSADNPMGVSTPSAVNAKRTAEFRKFLDDNNITYTKQTGKYGGNLEHSNIIEIDNPQQQTMIDNWLQKNSPQNENIIITEGRAIRYDPRTKQAYSVDITGKDLKLDYGQEDFYSQVGSNKYSFPLYGEEEVEIPVSEFLKYYNK
jgi:hypothetical protein